MKLIPMTDFVLKQNSTEGKPLMATNWAKEFELRFNKIVDYANFLKQTLTLGMFVPCDDDGNVLDEPNYCDDYLGEYLDKNDYYIVMERFNEAKSKVIFNGFQVRKQSTYSIVSYKDVEVWVTWNKSKTIEDLIPYNLDLTISF